MEETPKSPQKPPAPIPLAAGFREADRAEWEALAAAALKGQSDGAGKQTYEGVNLRPLYRADDAPEAPSDLNLGRELGTDADEDTARTWDIRQFHRFPDPEILGADIRADLDGGAASIMVGLDGAVRRATPEQVDEDGAAIRTLDDLDQALGGVDLAHTPISLRSGALGFPAATLYLALAARRGVPPSRLVGDLGLDPLTALAAEGVAPGGLECQFEAAADLAQWCATQAPGLSAIAVDTSPYHAAGATETEDIAFAAATAVAYLGALTGAGMEISAAARQISFTLSVGGEVFQTIAKLRAMRLIWKRITSAAGAEGEACVATISAVTASRMLARRDVWVNVLRATVSCFAAGVGGADAIIVRPHTDALGHAEPLARRVARNLQTILVQESALARVADPAGGSYYVEQLTDQYARAAWTLFQEIEAAGGMAAALRSGRVAAQLEDAWAARERNLAHCRDPLTGLSSFPDLDEAAPPVRRPEMAALRERVLRISESLAPDAVPQNLAVDTMIESAKAGANLAALAAAFGAGRETLAPLARHRLGEGFEALRDASDAWLARTGRRPALFLVRLGTPADYTDRTVFATSYFAAGGIATIESTPIENAGAESAEILAHFAESGAELAVICSSDSLYASMACDVARQLTEAGARTLILAGKPGGGEDGPEGVQEAEYRAAGIDRFIHAGDDMLATLRDLAAEIGMIER